MWKLEIMTQYDDQARRIKSAITANFFKHVFFKIWELQGIAQGLKQKELQIWKF